MYIRDKRPLLLGIASGQMVGTFGNIPLLFKHLHGYFDNFSDNSLSVVKPTYFITVTHPSVLNSFLFSQLVKSVRKVV